MMGGVWGRGNVSSRYPKYLQTFGSLSHHTTVQKHSKLNRFYVIIFKLKDRSANLETNQIFNTSQLNDALGTDKVHFFAISNSVDVRGTSHSSQVTSIKQSLTLM